MFLERIKQLHIIKNLAVAIPSLIIQNPLHYFICVGGTFIAGRDDFARISFPGIVGNRSIYRGNMDDYYALFGYFFPFF